MAECSVEKNTSMCTCTYPSCPRKGLCCECIAHHRAKGQMPGCYFPKDIESGYDRSVSSFIAVVSQRGTGYLR